jgi:trimeric autotransporter adhesin
MKQCTSFQSPFTKPFADRQPDLRLRCLRAALAILLAVACFCAPTHLSAQGVLITLTPYTGTVNGQVNLQAYPGTQTADATIAVSFSLGPGSSPAAIGLAPITITGAAASWLQEDTVLYPSCFGGGGKPVDSFYLSDPPFCSLPLNFMVPPGTTPGVYPVNVTVSAYYNPTNAEFAQSIVINVEVLPLPTGSGNAALNFVPSLTTFAGTGQGGYSGDQGPATSAELNRPSDIAIDSTGNVFIADTANFLIRKVDTTGKISTYAGVPQTGGVGNYTGEGGPATSATLQGPGALALSPSGDLYFTDGITSVRKIDATTGVITTYAGPVDYEFGYSGDGGPATSAVLYGPDGLALDPDGNLFIAEFWTNDVRVVNKATGIITPFAGQNTWNNVPVGAISSPPYPGYSGDGGPATQATLYRPFSLAFKPGNALAGPGDTLYIADGENHRVRGVEPKTGISTVIGMGAWGVGSAASVGAEGTPATTAAIYPESIALDSIGNAYLISAGKLYKVDGTGNIYQYPSTSTSVSFGGNGDTTNVKVSSIGDLYVAAANNNNVYKISQANALAFGSVNVGSSSTGQFLTLQNTGSGPLFFNTTPYAIVGDFTVGNSGTCSFSAALTSGSSCTVQIIFIPQTPGGQNGSITFASNDPGTALSATLTGTGVAVAAPLTISPTSLSFPNTLAGTSSAPLSVTLTAGSKAVNFIGQGIIMTTANAAYFPQTNNCGATLVAGASCTIQVTFKPTNAFPVTAQLSITDNVGGFQQTFVPVTGQGTAPVGTLSPGFINFPDTPVGTASSQQVIQLSNTGTASLSIAGITLTGPDAASYSLHDTCPGTLAVGAPACNIYITFTPRSTATTTAFLTITDNAPGGEQDAFLGGTGTVPVATFSTNTLTFPTTQVGQSSISQVVNVQDTGGAQLNVNSITLTGANPGSYTMQNNCGGIAPGASCSITVNFTPMAGGTQNATITVYDNTTTSPHSISLIGVGTTAAQAQVISFAPLPTQVTVANAPLSLGATGGASGNPVIFSVTGPGSIIGNTLTINGLGTIKVTASQAGNSSYSAATPVSQSIIVSQFLAPSISAEAATPNSAGSESLGASINPNNFSTTWWFAWGLSPTTMTQTSPLHTGLTGTSPIPLGVAALNLQSGTTYYYRAVAKSAGGQTLGATQSFVAP